MNNSKAKHGQQFNEISKQVKEVTNIMQQNVKTVLSRGEKLDELDLRADKLEKNAIQFKNKATKIKKKMWWSNVKMMIFWGTIGVIILIIILCAIFS